MDEVILALDVLEHFNRRDARALVAEFSRITRPGCALILCTIDIERTARWIIEKPGEILYALEHIYCRQNHDFNYHGWGYTHMTLQDLLHEWRFNVDRIQDSSLHAGNMVAYATRV